MIPDELAEHHAIQRSVGRWKIILTVGFAVVLAGLVIFVAVSAHE